MIQSPIAGPKDPDIKEDGQTATRPRIDKPKMYKVLLHNDDYSTMEFVVEVLMSVFRKTKVEANRIMLSVHSSGQGVAGIYTREIAEAKTGQALDLARSRAYPLLVTTEPE